MKICKCGIKFSTTFVFGMFAMSYLLLTKRVHVSKKIKIPNFGMVQGPQSSPKTQNREILVSFLKTSRQELQ